MIGPKYHAKAISVVAIQLTGKHSITHEHGNFYNTRVNNMRIDFLAHDEVRVGGYLVSDGWRHPYYISELEFNYKYAR